MKPHLNLYYDKAAPCWEEGFPLGNGRMGAMVFGPAGEETIALNDDTLYSGTPKNILPPGRPEILRRARELIFAGTPALADELLRTEFLESDSESYQPAGALHIAVPVGEVSDYRRELHLEDGVAYTTYTSRGVRFRREYFVSRPADCLVVKMTADQPNSVNCVFELTSALRGSALAEGHLLQMSAQCPEHNRRDEFVQGDAGIKAQLTAAVLQSGGTLLTLAHSIEVNNADSVILYLTVKSNFIDWKTPPAADFPELRTATRSVLDAATEKGFYAVKREHVSDYGALFSRSLLTMPENSNSRLSTDRRILLNEQEPDLNLIALFCNFSRYLMIAGSRPGTQAMNLQGIWNDCLRPPWGCNYTMNINLQMNYWPADPANLDECAEPYYDFVGHLAEAGTKRAESTYGLPGWCAHHNSDIWCFNASAKGYCNWGYFPLAGLWLCHQIFEHYSYTGDSDFLRRHYPVLREAARFALCLLVSDGEGHLTTCPSASPENFFIEPATGAECAVDSGCAVDWGLIAEHFHDLLNAMAELELDDELKPALENALRRLKRPGIGRHGELLEYGHDYEETDVHHRHLSHLVCVYPGNSATEEKNPDLFAAAKITAERRGDLSTGWAMGWRLALQARFGNGEKVNRIVQNLLTLVEPDGKTDSLQSAARRNDGHGGVYLNLLDAHPPFQIDGNFGALAGILEALVQSHRRNDAGAIILELLKALPRQWHSGALSGVRARGGLTLDLEWRENRLVRLTINAATAQTVELRYGDARRVLELRCGRNEILSDTAGR